MLASPRNYKIVWKTLKRAIVFLFTFARLVGIPVFYLLVLIVLLANGITSSVSKFFKKFRHIKFNPPKVGGSIAKKIALAFSLSALLFVISSTAFWFLFIKDLPPAEALTQRSIDVSTKIYDRNGNLLYKLYKDKNRTPVALSEVPMQVRLATLAAEDADFYEHPGISIKGMARATIKFLQEGKITGGSTITQQLVKNALLSPDKTVARKIREVLIAIAVEQKYTKDQILQMYLNEVSYGGTAYGVEEASEQYFNKKVSELDLAQAALLAGLPKSPTLLSPFGSSPEMAVSREHEILRQMLEKGFIDQGQYNSATEEKLEFAPDKVNILAPHFVMYVRDQLQSAYGEKYIYANGLEVHTTLDLNYQSLAESAVTSELKKLTRLHVGNGAALVVNPKTGEVLAMVGSKDYFSKDGNVNVVLRPRQPGSSIKVVNYSYALSHGFTAATILDDSPVSFPIAGHKPYTPKDYDGKFRGKITLRSALAESRNIPAVRVLNQIGVDNMVAQGRKMGITTWDDPSRFGLSLTLGAGEVTLLDLAKVYSTIAAYGQRPDFYGIESITDSKGKILYTHKENSEAVLDPRVAYILTDILRDNSARAPAFGTHSALLIPGHPEVAVKTGTSNDMRDNLAVGYNQNILTAVWVGNNDNSPMSRVASGITGASPIWNKIMSGLLSGTSSTAWAEPSGLTHAVACKKKRTEIFLSEQKPSIVCPESSNLGFRSGQPWQQSPE